MRTFIKASDLDFWNSLDEQDATVEAINVFKSYPYEIWVIKWLK